MNNLRVFDPFDVDILDETVRNLFRPARLESLLPPTQIKVDIEEADDNYLVRAELPGVKKDDIHVDIDGNLVTINAEVKNEKDVKKGGRVLRSERYYGAVSRAFTLAGDVDEGHVKARFDNGLLELTLPKRASKQMKRIAIQ